MKIWILWVTAVIILTVTAEAQQTVTVISVSGEVAYRAREGEWRPVRPGERLPADAQVRTGPSGALGLITAQGAIVRIPGGSEQRIIASERPAESAGTRIFSVLRELFSDARRTRVAATRGAQDEASPAAQTQLARAYGELWEGLTRKPRLSPDDLSLAFETAAFFQERPYQNRSVSLLAKLARDLPEDAGIAELARQARESYGLPATLELIVHPAAGGARSAASGEALRSGDGVQVRYRSETESFFYLYLHTWPERGEPETARIHPAPGMASPALPPNAPLALPNQADAFVLDETRGREYFWAWACAAPLLDALAEQGAMQAVARSIQQRKPFTAETVGNVAPPGCMQGFAYEFAHR
jgi:hypothetical protein